MAQPIRLTLLLALLALPLVEIALLIKAGGALGFWPVLLIVILSAILGSAVIRQRGLSVLGRVYAEIETGRSGLEPMLDSLLVVTAGILLILPGLMTDSLGLLLLLPPIRTLAARLILPHVIPSPAEDTRGHEGRFKTRTPNGQAAGEPGSGPVVIDGDYERLGERTIDPNASKPGQPR